MKLKVLLTVLGLSTLLACIGEPVFSALSACPAIRTANDEGRQYVDFAGDVRLRLTPRQADAEVALRGISAFDANESVYRSLQLNEAVSLSALESTQSRPVVEVFTKNFGAAMEFVAVYHRPHGALVISRFQDQTDISCERLDNQAASDYVADLARANAASTGSLKFAASQSVYHRMGL